VFAAISRTLLSSVASLSTDAFVFQLDWWCYGQNTPEPLMNGMELKIAARKSLTISAPRFPTSPRRNQDPHPPPCLQPTTEPRQCRHAARSCSQPCQPLRAPARLCPGAETPRALTPAWSAVPARRPRRRRSLDRSRRRGIPAEPAATPVLSPATIARAHNVPGHIRPLPPPATQFPRLSFSSTPPLRLAAKNSHGFAVRELIGRHLTLEFATTVGPRIVPMFF
jgi:hypothetical protein